MSSNNKMVFLTGTPGVGKTTLVIKACKRLQELKRQVDGFYTEEIRNKTSKAREGFDVVLLDGKRRRLARSLHTLKADEITKFKVGQYCVFPDEFADFVLPIFGKSQPGTILIVDEIGKMELLSEKFRSAASEALKRNEVSILGTIPALEKRPNAVKDILRLAKDYEEINVTFQNRNVLLDEIVSRFL